MQKLLDNLKKTYCRLKPSAIEGIGVFAIRDIPKGENPFPTIGVHKWKKFTLDQLKVLDPEVLRMIDDFFVIEKDETVYIPECGLNGINITYFLNTSKNPNVKTKNGRTFIATRDIKKGEELTTDYASYDRKYE